MTAIRLFFFLLGIATFATTVLLLGVGCVGELRHWLAHRHDERDEFGNYLAGLREPGMGDVFDAPTSFRDLNVTKAPTVRALDDARQRRTR